MGKLRGQRTAPKQARKGQHTGWGQIKERVGLGAKVGRESSKTGGAEQKTYQETRVLNIQLHPLRLPIPP